MLNRIQGQLTVLGALACIAVCTPIPAQAKDAPQSPLTPEEQAAWSATLVSGDYGAIAKAYADYMIEHGRDQYGKVHSPLFLSTLNRKTGKPFRPPCPLESPFPPGTINSVPEKSNFLSVILKERSSHETHSNNH